MPPARERAFFGIGPVSIGIPFRYEITDRQHPLIAAKGCQDRRRNGLLAADGLAASRFAISPNLA